MINKYGWHDFRWSYAIRFWIFCVDKLTLGSKGNMWKVNLLWQGNHHIPLKLSYFILVTAHLWYFYTKYVTCHCFVPPKCNFLVQRMCLGLTNKQHATPPKVWYFALLNHTYWNVPIVNANSIVLQWWGGISMITVFFMDSKNLAVPC